MAEASPSSPAITDETLLQRVRNGRTRTLREKLAAMVRENPARTGLDALTEENVVRVLADACLDELKPDR